MSRSKTLVLATACSLWAGCGGGQGSTEPPFGMGDSIVLDHPPALVIALLSPTNDQSLSSRDHIDCEVEIVPPEGGPLPIGVSAQFVRDARPESSFPLSPKSVEGRRYRLAVRMSPPPRAGRYRIRIEANYMAPPLAGPPGKPPKIVHHRLFREGPAVEYRP